MTDVQKTSHGIRVGDVEVIWAKNSQEFLFSHSLLIHGENPIIIDPSANFSYIHDIAKSRYVKKVINSHYHGDHRSLNHLFKDVVFSSHRLDASAIRDFNVYLAHATDDATSSYAIWIRETFQKYQIVQSPVSETFEDGTVFDTGTERIHVVHLPGHTPGHCGFYFENADLFFCSDIDLTPYGPWYASPASHLGLWRESLKRATDFIAQSYIPSHGERVYDREQYLEKITRFSQILKTRHEVIQEEFQNHPEITAQELCGKGIIYRKSAVQDNLKAHFEWMMIQKHIDEIKNNSPVIWGL